MSLRPRSTDNSIGVMPNMLRASNSAPLLIASRAAAMSPRLIASNKASFGDMSVGSRVAGATVSAREEAPGRAGGGNVRELAGGSLRDTGR